MARNYKQGIYEVVNKEKYIGIRNPRFLSSYELKVFTDLDRHPDVIKWGAEVVIVPYLNPTRITKDGSMRKSRYIVDIYVKYRARDGELREEIIEIKPSHETVEPKRGKKKQSSYDRQLLTFMQNSAKWEAAKRYAEDRGMTFRILTEKEIFL